MIFKLPIFMHIVDFLFKCCLKNITLCVCLFDVNLIYENEQFDVTPFFSVDDSV